MLSLWGLITLFTRSAGEVEFSFSFLTTGYQPGILNTPTTSNTNLNILSGLVVSSHGAFIKVSWELMMPNPVLQCIAISLIFFILD